MKNKSIKKFVSAMLIATMAASMVVDVDQKKKKQMLPQQMRLQQRRRLTMQQMHLQTMRQTQLTQIILQASRRK